MTNAAAATTATPFPAWAAVASRTPSDLGIEWDAENRLTRVCTGACQPGTDPPNMLARFVYDGEGRRYQRIAGSVTRTYLYDRAQLVEERLSSGGTFKYFDGPGIDQHLASQDQSGAISYYAADHLGSVTDVITSAGGVSLSRQYDAWGNLLTGDTTGGYAFTGREWDAEIGLCYYRARYYDPKIGRFITEDPIRFDDGINFYVYVRNNPVNASDPSGLKIQVCQRQAMVKAMAAVDGNHSYFWDPRQRGHMAPRDCGKGFAIGSSSPGTTGRSPGQLEHGML